MNILLFTGFYLPGFKGGGPIRTIVNMVEVLGSEINFFIVTSDRDLGDKFPYSGVTTDLWQQVGKAQVYYASSSKSYRNMMSIIRRFDGDAMHLNSFFSLGFSIFPLLLSRWINPGLPVVVGPRGEFSVEALKLKPIKKRAYVACVKLLGIYKNVIWHASTVYEAEDIYRVMGRGARVRVAIDIATPAVDLNLAQRVDAAALRVVFVSRISPMKNLLGAIDVLKRVDCPVSFHIYGPAEDQKYWNDCQDSALELPRHISLNYHGPLRSSEVALTLAQYDVFFLPTLGENFGHVIAEALSSGLPILISNNTPWRDLRSKKLGWDIPLERSDTFAQCIEICYSMPAVIYNQWRQRIRAWALENIGSQEAIEQNRQLFMNLGINNEH